MARSLGENGLDTLEVACDLTLETGVVTATIVLNEMRRLTEAARPKALPAMAWLPILKIEPKADCARYDALRECRHGY